MYIINSNTLQTFNSRIFKQTRDISCAPAEPIIENTIRYLKNKSTISIGETAVNFYLMNHVTGSLSTQYGEKDVLSKNAQQLCDTYLNTGGQYGLRMFHDTMYMLLTMCSFTKPDPFHLEDVAQYYPKAANLMKQLCGTHKENNTWWTPNASKNLVYLQKAVSQSQDVPLGELIQAMGYILDVRQKDLAYGPLWKDVARAFYNFTAGAISIENFIDNSFTFCHCSGSYFEKGALFTAVGPQLFDVLDIQHAGYIPQMVKEKRNQLSHNKQAQDYLNLALQELPDLTPAVKWGSVKKFTQQQQTFHNKYANHWNKAFNGAAPNVKNGGHHHKVPNIFMPLDEDGYEAIQKDMKKGSFK